MSGPKPEVDHEIAYMHHFLVIHIILPLKRDSDVIIQMIELDKFSTCCVYCCNDKQSLVDMASLFSMIHIEL